MQGEQPLRRSPHACELSSGRQPAAAMGPIMDRFPALVKYHKPEAWQLYVTATGGVPENTERSAVKFSCGCESISGLAAVFVFIFTKQRSSQVVRQRFHTPRIAGSNPASATIFQYNLAREEDSNPPRLGRGDTRGGTGARDHFTFPP
jgi:hypothetical protein